MTASYGLEDYVADLRRITAETTDESEIFDRLGPLAQQLVADKSWLKPEYYQADAEQRFGINVLHEEAGHSLAIFMVSWDPHKGVAPHDHGTWALIAGVEGIERNTSYARLDDRSRDGYAEIEIKSELQAGPGDLVCMKNGGIHSVRNDSDAVTLSLHTYGMHVNHTERSVYDMEANSAETFQLKIA
ncbi:MAG: cysteine dioxygenase family protein [Alphaproteobacteria bacterium]